MVFPSLPIYLDPTNWSQQQAGIDIGTQNPSHLQQPSASTVTAVTVETDGCYQGSIRPGSMTDRARMLKINQNDAASAAAQKCPRCESTNTKFCYYNNYSLSQPRHFCKACRRYWTRGGALRSVPVGGGCRKNNKRSKGNSVSKPPSKPNRSNDHRQVGTIAIAGGCTSENAKSSSNNNNNGCNNSNVNLGISHFPTQFPFFPSLHHYNNNGYVSQGIGSMVAKNITNTTNVEYQLGRDSSVGEQWRFLNSLQQQQQQQQQQRPNHQQFPFMTNLEPQIGLFQFGGENNGETPRSFISSKAMDSSSASIGMVKMEENNHQRLSLPKNLLSGSGNSNDLFWNEVPSFTPSSSELL
ncbi:unnamed protein product [Lathyrus sativus]|nr:unnamed protein product [Lathyrus sativus]CAK8066169.1 unnamed protein product [Lathyrus sativus]